MKKGLLFILLFFCVSGFSQDIDEDEPVLYTLLTDNPNYTYWGVGLSYDMSINPYNFTLAALGFDGVVMHEKFNFNFHSRMHLGERLTDNSINGQPTSESIYESERSRDIGFNISYFLKNDVKLEDQEVKLKRTGSKRYAMMIPAKRSYRWSADLGFSGGTSYYNFGDATLTGVDETGGSAEIESKDENDALATYLTQKVARVGASRVTTANFSLKPEKYRKKYVKDYTRIYFHALVGFGQTLDDVLVPFPNVQNLELYTRYELNTNAKMNPIGAAIGYEYYVMKKMGVSWMAELGVQPGPKYSFGNNVYLDIKLRFHLGMMMK